MLHIPATNTNNTFASCEQIPHPWCLCEHAVDGQWCAVYGGGVQPDGHPGQYKQAQRQRQHPALLRHCARARPCHAIQRKVRSLKDWRYIQVQDGDAIAPVQECHLNMHLHVVNQLVLDRTFVRILCVRQTTPVRVHQLNLSNAKPPIPHRPLPSIYHCRVY